MLRHRLSALTILATEIEASFRKAPAAIACAAFVIAIAVSSPTGVHARATVPDGFDDEFVVGDLSAPVGMAFLPDGRLFFVEQKTFRVRLVVDGALAATDPVATAHRHQRRAR